MPSEWMNTWRHKNPAMKYMLWREKELEEFGLRFQDKCGHLMSKGEYRGASDMMRVEILDRFGGVYVDADSICLESIEDAPFMDTDFFVGRDHYHHEQKEHINRVANGTIGSIPGHPVLKDYLERINKSGVTKWWKMGGSMLTSCIENKNVMILPVCTFYPRDWHGRVAPVEGKIYAHHMWGETKKAYDDPQKMKVAVITANTGNFEKPLKHPKQSIACDFFHFNDENFPPRFNAMTPRLQARIVKMFGWQIVPDYDFYIWVDSSCVLSGPNSVKLFLSQCQDVDVVVFKHPNRGNIQQEADYLKHRLAINCPYITPRYENELIDEQLAEIAADKSFVDQNLFASTAVVYRNNEKVKDMMKEWWHHVSRYHSIDQLSFPYVLMQSGCKVKIIPDKYSNSAYITYVRNK